jgi:parallel beta-helix repeat protein
LERKIVSGIMLSLLVISTFTLAFNIQPVKAWTGTVYIRADGSIDPPDAPISTIDNVTYTLTGNILSDADGIVVERSNVLIDGNGYTLQGISGLPGSGCGLNLTSVSNVTTKNGNIQGFEYGVYLHSTSSNVISGNNIINNWIGISLRNSSDNSMFGNILADNAVGIEVYRSSNSVISRNNITWNSYYGIHLLYSLNNSISWNNIRENYLFGIRLGNSSDNIISANNVMNNWEEGISLRDSSNNKFYHNNFVNNAPNVHIDTFGYANSWDDGYPSGGNYWSDHVTVDVYSGINQDEPGSDGIVNEPYIIDEYNQDRYPLRGPIKSFSVTWYETIYQIEVVSNSTILGFYFDRPSKLIGFDVAGLDGSKGFSRVAIPKELLWCNMLEEWIILVEGESVSYNAIEDATHTFLYFTYAHSIRSVLIIATHAIAPPPWERRIGVEAGDWVLYDIDLTYYTNDPNPPVTPPTEVAQMVKMTVTYTEFTYMSLELVYYYEDYEKPASGGHIDVLTGPSMALLPWVAANLSAGDYIYPNAYDPDLRELKINETISLEYLGLLRENNHLQTTMHSYFEPYEVYYTQHLYWDKITGISTEVILEIKCFHKTMGYETIYSISYKIKDTNLWKAPIPTTIDELKTEIEELGSQGEIDNRGIVKSLVAKLNAAQKLVDKGKIDEAKSILEEDFISQVQNLTDIHITPEAADILIESAEYILSHL